MNLLARSAQSSLFVVSIALGAGCESSASSGAAHDAGHGRSASRDAGGHGSTADGVSIYVGELADSDARVALIATQSHLRSYFCGGDSSYMQLSHWLKADLSSGHADLAAQNDGDWELHVDIGDTADGRVISADGVEHEFSARLVRAQDHTLNGVFEANGECGKLGLIVVQKKTSDSVIGQGACIGADLVTVEQVNPVLPISLDGDGSVRVTLAGQNDEFALQPATPPAD